MNDPGSTPARVLLIGTGSIGQRHWGNVRALWPRADCAALRLSPQEQRSDRPVPRVLDTWAEALAWRPDMAIIASPSDAHRDPIERLCRAGVATLIEKPVVASASDVKAIDRLLASGNLPPTQVGCVLRFLPAVETLRDWVAAGRLGQIAHARFTAGQYLPDWRPGSDYRTGYSADPDRGGGVILDLVHELDLAVAIFGDLEMLHAVADKRSTLEIASEDVALVTLRSAEGVLIHVALDYFARQPRRRIEIVGETATAELDFIARSLTLTDSNGIVESLGDGFDAHEAYRTELIELAGAARGGPAPRLPLAEGMRATRLAVAARDAARRPMVAPV